MDDESVHPALVTVHPSAPLEVHHVTTPIPVKDQVKVIVQYTVTSALDLHQADGHFLVRAPQILGSSVAGTVIGTGPEVKMLKIGDRVFGYTFRGDHEKSYQLFVVTSEKQLAKLPRRPDSHFTREDDGGGQPESGCQCDEQNQTGEYDHDVVDVFDMEECVSVVNDFVSAWYGITADLKLDLAWPRPPWFRRQLATQTGLPSILIWGGGSSVGQYALRILAWYGYNDITVIASNRHHHRLYQYGASECISYAQGNINDLLNEIQDTRTKNRRFSHILDCIGNLHGSIEPISNIVRGGSRVAIFLPVIVRDTSEGTLPEYTLDVRALTEWPEGVDAVGIRTHFYTQNEYLAEHLQSHIMPAALTLGIIDPNARIMVTGETMLQRAEKALNLLRLRRANGAKLVWKVVEDELLESVLQGVKAQQGDDS